MSTNTASTNKANSNKAAKANNKASTNKTALMHSWLHDWQQHCPEAHPWRGLFSRVFFSSYRRALVFPQRDFTQRRALRDFTQRSALLFFSLSLLTACSTTDESPVGSTQWQVSEIYDSNTRAHLLPETEQGRSFVVFGQESLTGASGCMILSGAVTWNKQETEISISDFRSDMVQDSRSCMPGDEDTAQRLHDVLNDATLMISRPSSTSLKLQQKKPDLPPWDSAPSIEFISGQEH